MQMQQDRLARRVKNAGMKFLELMGNEKNIMLGEILYCWQIIKALGKSAGIIYELSRFSKLNQLYTE